MASRSQPAASLDDTSPEDLMAMLQAYESGGRNPDTQDLPQELADMLRSWENAQGETSSSAPHLGGASRKETVVPEPGFVVKTSDDAGHKVFINVCGSDKVAAPGDWAGGKVPDAVRGALDRARTEDDLDADSRETLRFPLSLAESRLDVDKQGEPATVYDCVLNNEVVRQCGTHRPLKIFIIQLVMGWIEHKHAVVLDPKYKLPRMRYKGDGVRPHTMRAETRTPLVTEVKDVQDAPHVLRASKTATGAKIATEAVGPTSKAAKPSTQPAAPQKGLPVLRHEVNYMGKPVYDVIIHVRLPLGHAPVSASEVMVEVEGELVHVDIPRCSPVTIELPFAVSGEGAMAELGSGRFGQGLGVRLPYRPIRSLVEERQRLAAQAYRQPSTMELE